MRSLNFRLTVFLVSVLLVILCAVSGLFYYGFRTNIVSELSRSRLDTMQMVAQQADAIESDLKTVTDLIANDPTLRSYALSDELRAPMNVVLNSYLSNQYLKYYSTFGRDNYPFVLAVIFDNGYSFSSARDTGITAGIQSSPWFQSGLRELRDDYRAVVDDPGGSGKVLASVRTLRRGTFNNFAASVVLYVDERALYDCYAEILNGHNDIYILNEARQIVSARDPGALGGEAPCGPLGELFGDGDYALRRQAGADYLYTRRPLRHQDWIVLERMPMRWLMQSFRRVTLFVVLVAAALGALCIGLSVYFSRRVARPLRAFCGRIDEAEKSAALLPVIGIGGYQEIETLTASYNRMLERLRRLMADTCEQEQKIRASEIAFLRAQITPHFLYNTLFSIKCTVDTGRGADASEMISLLISMLRATVDAQNPYTTLAEECGYLRTYIALQQLRFGNELRLVLDVPEALSACLLLRHLLQPIVENAIFHGIEPRGTGGVIRIVCREDGQDLTIDLCDDGVGMQTLPDLDAAPHESAGARIGLRNIQARIRLNYGQEFGVTLLPCEQGAHIRVRLPKIT